MFYWNASGVFDRLIHAIVTALRCLPPRMGNRRERVVMGDVYRHHLVMRASLNVRFFFGPQSRCSSSEEEERLFRHSCGEVLPCWPDLHWYCLLCEYRHDASVVKPIQNQEGPLEDHESRILWTSSDGRRLTRNEKPPDVRRKTDRFLDQRLL